MTQINDQQQQTPSVVVLIRMRLYRSGLLLGAMLIVFLVLYATGQLAGIVTIICVFSAVLMAAILPANDESDIRQTSVTGKKRAASPALEADQAVSLMQAIPDPVALIDGAGTIVFVNQHARLLLGAEIEGTSAFMRFRDPNVLSAMRSAISTGKRQETDYNYRADMSRWFRLMVVPVERSASANKPDHFLIHLRDISESHRLEKMRSDFVGNASHELRTPLASLKGYLDTLAGPAKNDTKAREQFIGIMQEQAGRMERLINDLLSLSRFETGMGQMAFVPVDLGDVLFHVRSALAPMAESCKVTLDIDDEALLTVAPMVHGNRDELIQVFENLMENSIKYGGEGKAVSVRIVFDVEFGEQIVRIEIADDGPGIAPEHIPRLTERFYRVDVQSSRNKQGTGLGLAIVKHILSRHGGRLSVKSKLGEGSVFVTVLPILADK